MEVRANVLRITNSPLAVKLKKRRRKKQTDDSSSDDASNQFAIHTPKKKSQANKRWRRSKTKHSGISRRGSYETSVTVDPKLDPFSGRFDIHAILVGETPYSKNYKDEDDTRGRKLKGLATTSFSSLSSISTKTSIPKRRSKWPSYSSFSHDLVSSFSSDIDYETYSCSSVDCHKHRVRRGGATEAGYEMVPCPRTENTHRRKMIGPLKNRGYQADEALSAPYAVKLGHTRLESTSLDSDIAKALKSHPDLKTRQFRSRSVYSYSYSSCSDSNCSKRGVYRHYADGQMKTQPSYAKHRRYTSSSSNNTIQKKDVQRSRSSSSNNPPSHRQKSRSEKPSSSRSNDDDHHHQSPVKPLHGSISSSSSKNVKRSSISRSASVRNHVVRSSVLSLSRPSPSKSNARSNDGLVDVHQPAMVSTAPSGISSQPKSSRKDIRKDDTIRRGSSRSSNLHTKATGQNVIARTGMYEASIKK